MCNVRLNWLSVGLFMTKAQNSSFLKDFTTNIKGFAGFILGRFQWNDKRRVVNPVRTVINFHL